jgi:hypothetical protein
LPLQHESMPEALNTPTVSGYVRITSLTDHDASMDTGEALSVVVVD